MSVKKFHLKVAITILAIAIASLIFAYAQTKKTASDIVRARRVEDRHTITVSAKGDFQKALNSAQCGDAIVLQAGATYGNASSFVLPYKGPCSGTDADYITIQTSNLAGIAASGQRIDPAVHGGAMARLVATGTQPVIKTQPLAHHYKFIGIEFTSTGAGYIPILVNLGTDTTRDQREAMKGFVFDRCFVHPPEISSSNLANPSSVRTAAKGIFGAVVDLYVINSYLAGFTGYYNNELIDSMCIGSDVGPGPIHVINNYLEAWYSSVFIGGADAAVNPVHTGTIAAGATIGQATLSSVTDLAVGDLVAFQLNLPPPGSTVS